MDFDAIKQRLTTRVPELRYIGDALALAALVKSGQLPAQSPSAWIMLASLSARAPAAASGLYIQPVTETLSVVLSVLTHSAAGVGKAATVHDLVRAVVEALAGWGPDDVAVIELARGEVMSMTGGQLTYRIDFNLSNELRIQP